MRTCSVIFFCISFLLGIQATYAQDERFIRKMLSGELIGVEENQDKKQQRKYIWETDSPIYLYDINNDGLLEGIEYSKREGEDWLTLYESNYQKVFEKKLPKTGDKSRLYKIKLSKLSKITKLLILFFYEGHTHYIDTEDSVRLFFLTFDKNDFSTLSLTEGPRIMDRVRTSRQDEHARSYSLELKDFNGDGVKEVLLRYRGIVRIYTYLGEGSWREN